MLVLLNIVDATLATLACLRLRFVLCNVQFDNLPRDFCLIAACKFLSEVCSFMHDTHGKMLYII